MTASTASAPHRSGLGSQLTQQLQHEKQLQHDGKHVSSNASPPSHEVGNETSRSSSKSRSLSDAPKPSLSPSPAFRESSQTTRDDISITSSPVTPRRPSFPVRGLSLQMPQGAGLNSPNDLDRVPLSPKLDASQIFGSPGSVLPRRSRGLDFSRACTNLHHSTLAESSPDSSPTITGKSMLIPRKGFMNPSSVPESSSNTMWSAMANPDRSTTISSSVSSVNMLDSETDSSDASEGEMMDPGEAEDAMITTPQVHRVGQSTSNPFASGVINSPGGEWMGNYSPASASLMRLQRNKYRSGRSRKSSSSTSANSTKPSPGPLSPPLMKSIEAASGGYFVTERSRTEVQSRRESLSLGTNDLQLSDVSDEDEGPIEGSRSSSGGVPGTPTLDGSRGVIRRPVQRRSNLLPKSKGFARIKAALMEENAPVDSELKREGEVIRQVRESEPSSKTSPTLLPMASNESTDVIPEEDIMVSDSSAGATAGSSTKSFGHHAEKNSGGIRFWNQFQDERYRTPPPPTLNPRRSSSGVSDDISMETPPSSFSTTIHPDLAKYHNGHSGSRSSTPVPSVGPSASEVARKVNNKRRRDEDFDPASFKRRAVSPGMSVQSSPVMPQSPVFSKDGSGWGHPPPKAPSGHTNGDRSNSAGSVGPPKRVGLQGMTETHDGLMNMSIE